MTSERVAVSQRGDGGGRVNTTNAWGRSGKLTTFKPNRIVSLAKTFKEVGTYTALFSIQAPKNDGSHSNPEAIADVTWGAGGNAITRRVSVLNGMAISGTSDSIRVIMRDASTQAESGIEYPVTVLVSPGTRPTTGVPPLLFPGINVNPVTLSANNFADFVIPTNAGVKAVSVIAGSDPQNSGSTNPSIPDQQAVVQHLSPGITSVLKNYDARMFQYVPISPGTVSIRVRNRASAISIMFSIAWVIDG